MTRTQAYASGFLLTLFLAPIAAHADAGTPLMWAGMFHLAVLNFGVGVLEGTVLARLFRLPKVATQVAMVPANYLSAWTGFLLLRWLWTPLERVMPGQAPLFKAGPLLVLLVVASFLISVLLEWPFCAWAMRGTTGGWRLSLRASVIAQAASYALLIPFYLLVSPISLLTSAHIQPSLDFVRTPVATVFYIDPKGGDIWRIQTDGTAKAKVLKAGIHDPYARLFVRPHPKGCLFDLCEVRRSPGVYGANQLQKTCLIPNVGTGGALSSSAARGGNEGDDWFNFGWPVDLRPEDKREWTVWTEFWANGGISMRRGPSDDGWEKSKVYTLAFETPFEDWTCRDATVLPSNQVVFELGGGKGNAQVVILDMATRKLGFLAMGQGPVVVMSPESEGAGAR